MNRFFCVAFLACRRTKNVKFYGGCAGGEMETGGDRGGVGWERGIGFVFEAMDYTRKRKQL